MNCPYCGSRAVKRRKIAPSGGTQIVTLLMILFGITITILIPILGWIAGPMIILVALLIDGKRRKVLQCRDCRAVIAETV